MRKSAIFYSDGSIVECGFEDDEEVRVILSFKVSKKYLEAPVHGVQAVIQEDSIRCRHVLRGEDHFYPLPSGMLHAADNLTPFLVEHLKGLVKFGVCLDDEEYKEIMQRCKEYKRIPRNGPREPDPEQDLD